MRRDPEEGERRWGDTKLLKPISPQAFFAELCGWVETKSHLGLFIGSLANGAVLAIGKNADTKADITIVLGAANPGVTAPFSPANYTVTAGSTVTWVNQDTVTHTVTSTSVPAGASSFDSGLIPYGNTFSVTLTVPGTYEYHCSIHPFMTGEITVTS